MSIERKIYGSVGIAAIAILASAFLFPADRPESADLPWYIEHPTPHTARVFGLTLGESTPSAAERRFREQGDYALFRSPDGHLSAEVYFEQVNLAGLRSRIVLTLAERHDRLQAMHDRGLRSSATASGRKIVPTPDDVAHMRTLPIASLTMIPGVRLSDDLFLKRFGKPAEVIHEAGSDIRHQLYPQHALDITTGGDKAGKQVLQYVSPKDFDRLREPLLRQHGKPESR